VVGEDVVEGERVVRVLIGGQSAEDMHKDGSIQDSLVSEVSGPQRCPFEQVLGCMSSIRLKCSLF
jgi:hypothetical protein